MWQCGYRGKCSCVNTVEVLGQIRRLYSEGCEIVRLAVPTNEAALSLGKIKEVLTGEGIDLPLVADIHFDYKLALAAIENGCDKVRINPGNIGSEDRLRKVCLAAKSRGIPIRVGVNSGSLEKDILEKYDGVTPEGLAESALRNIHLLESMDFDNIVVSIKSSDVALNYRAHGILRDKTVHPFHIGITEAGTVERGKTKSAAGLGALLLAGIGDTIRISLTGDPVEEVIFAKEFLQAIGLRKTSINLVSCPTCGRTKVDLTRIADEIDSHLVPISKARELKGLPGLTVAVMGCAVNGPGEAREADIGVACGDGKGVLFQRGKIVKTVPEEAIVSEIIKMIDEHS